MKGVKTYTLLFILLTGFAITSYAQIPVEIPETSAEKGESINIPVNVGNLSGQGVIAYQTLIKYDVNILELIGISVNSTLSEIWDDPTVNTNVAGQ